jgi:hypothetical protein
MENVSPPEEFGPGQGRQIYLDQLTETGYTGWYDESGTPAPWPEDFCDPDSEWQPSIRDDRTDPDSKKPF